MMLENSATINFDILPGEHLLGALGRYHHLSSYRLMSKSLRGVTFDIKSLCPQAFNRTIFKDIHFSMTNRDNDFLTFIKPNTLINFYHPFAPEGLLSSKTPRAILPKAKDVFNRNKNWQWCPKCISEDIDSFGVPYFHVEHQLPAMFHCYKHKVPLLIRCDDCIIYRNNIEIIGVPPQPDSCIKCFDNIDEKYAFLDEDMQWLNETSLKLLTSDEIPFNLLKLQTAYQKWLGVGPINGRRTVAEQKSTKKAQVELENAFSPKLFSTIFNNPNDVLSKRVVNTLHIPKASFQPNYFLSPIVHLLIIRMMFGDIENIPLIN
tara:strand:- start:487 stop:1443 length:957 start_codon:yes stop_codon:yes gene_type:complete